VAPDINTVYTKNTVKSSTINISLGAKLGTGASGMPSLPKVVPPSNTGDAVADTKQFKPDIYKHF
jgi:hypothetical protein